MPVTLSPHCILRRYKNKDGTKQQYLPAPVSWYKADKLFCECINVLAGNSISDRC